MTDKESLYCNNCDKYLYFNIDTSKNGKLIIVCDHCGHQHCRYVHDGVVSDRRWDARNGMFQRKSKKLGVMRRNN